jgi:NAD+ kinase
MKLLETDKYDKNKRITEHKDYIEAKGGDGTLLKAINKYRHLNKPFFGLASGTVNFLMNGEGDMYRANSTFNLQLLKIEVTYWDSTTHLRVTTIQGFNDLVLGSFNGWINFNVTHKDNQIGTFSGSGIIISTAQGSTGINRNNNGTILPLTSKSWSVTGMQANRHINSIVEPSRLEIKCKARAPISLAVDGTSHIFHNVDKVVVTKGDTVEVLFNNLDELKRKRQ